MNGALATITAVMDPDKLELTLSMEGDVKRAPVYKGIDTDFFGRPITGDRIRDRSRILANSPPRAASTPGES